MRHVGKGVYPRYHSNMNSTDMFSLVPDPDDLLARSTEERGRLILQLLRENDTPDKAVAHSNFFNRANDFAAPPRYGTRQKKLIAA